jgi:hypothetical protein
MGENIEQDKKRTPFKFGNLTHELTFNNSNGNYGAYLKLDSVQNGKFNLGLK